MFRRMASSNPLIIIIPGIIAGLILIAGIIGVIVYTNSSLGKKNDPFSQRFMVKEEAPRQQTFQQFNAIDPDKQFELMEKLMNQQMEEMRRLHNAMSERSFDPMSVTGSAQTFSSPATLPSVSIENNPDNYVITVNLTENKGENKVEVNVDTNKIVIKSKTENRAGRTQSSASFYNSFGFNVPVDSSKVIKEKRGNNLIISVPKLNNPGYSNRRLNSSTNRASVI